MFAADPDGNAAADPAIPLDAASGLHEHKRDQYSLRQFQLACLQSPISHGAAHDDQPGNHLLLWADDAGMGDGTGW